MPEEFNGEYQRRVADHLERFELFGDEAWAELERAGLLPGPREEPPEERSHLAARIADRERGVERGDVFDKP